MLISTYKNQQQEKCTKSANGYTEFDAVEMLNFLYIYRHEGKTCTFLAFELEQTDETLCFLTAAAAAIDEW